MIYFNVTYEGKQYQNECSQYRKLQDFQDRFLSSTKIPIMGKSFCFFKNGLELLQNKNFLENNVKIGDTLELRLMKTFEFAFIKIDYKGQIKHVHCNFADKSAVLYNEAISQFSLQKNTFKLIYEGMEILEQEYMHSYKIQPNSIIHCQDAITYQNIISVTVLYGKQTSIVKIENDKQVRDLEQKVQNQYQLKFGVSLSLDGRILQCNQLIKDTYFDSQQIIIVHQKEQQLAQKINQQQEQTLKIIFIKDGQKTALEVHSSTTVQELIDSIGKSFGIPNQFQLSLEGMRLLNSKNTLQEEQIVKGSMLYYAEQRQAEEKEIKLIIVLQDKKTTIEVVDNMVIGALINELSESFGIQNAFALSCEGQRLIDPQKTLKQEGIVKGQTLYIVENERLFAQQQQIQHPQQPQLMQLNQHSKQLSIIYVQIEYRGQIMTIDLESSTQISDIIQYIKVKFEIAEQLQVQCKGQILDPTKTMQFYGISRNDILEIQVVQQNFQKPQSQEIKIIIEYQANRIAIQVFRDTLVKEVIDAMKIQFGILIPISIYLNGQRLLNPSKTLEQENILKGSFLNLIAQQNQNQQQQNFQSNMLIETGILPNQSQFQSNQDKRQNLINIILNHNNKNIVIEIDHDIQIFELFKEIATQFKISNNFSLFLEGQRQLNPQRTLKQEQVVKGDLILIEEKSSAIRPTNIQPSLRFK